MFTFLDGNYVISNLSLVNNNFVRIIKKHPKCITSFNSLKYYTAAGARTIAPLNSFSLQKIITYPALQKLRIACQDSVTDEVLNILATSLKNIQELDLSWCKITDVGLKAIAPYLKNTQKLDISVNREITSAGLIAIAPYLIQVQSLNLNACEKITDTGLRAILKTCSATLQHLDIGNCPNITIDVLEEFAPQLTRLRSLGLYDCRGVTLAGLIRIAPYFKNLQNLDFGGRNIPNAQLKKLIQYFPNLQSLALRRNDALTDQGLKMLVSSCPHLQQLELDSCYNITNAGLQVIIRNLVNLQSLDLRWCKKLSPQFQELFNHQEIIALRQTLLTTGNLPPDSSSCIIL